MVSWDCAPTLGLDEEDSDEEIQLSSVNVSTRIKGPVMDDRLILPKIRRIHESMKRISSNTQKTSKFDLVNKKYKVLVVNTRVNIVENKTENSKKGPVNCDMGYDIVEEIKKTKENISLFELCNFPQQRKSFWRLSTLNLVVLRMTFNLIKKLMNLALKKFPSLKICHSCCLSIFSITMCIIVW